MKITLIKPNLGRLEHSLYVDEGRMEPLPLGVLAGMTPREVDVRLFDESEIPWTELAFPVMNQTLRHYFEDRSKGEFNTHIGSVRAVGEGAGRRIEVEMLQKGGD